MEKTTYIQVTVRIFRIFQAFIVSALLFAVALADNPAPYQEPAPGPAVYSYNWAVKDDYTSNNYGQNEERNGDATSGSYYVALPDGRLQKVTYSVNGYGGYVADVTYEGEAQYPEAKPYKPAAYFLHLNLMEFWRLSPDFT